MISDFVDMEPRGSFSCSIDLYVLGDTPVAGDLYEDDRV